MTRVRVLCDKSLRNGGLVEPLREDPAHLHTESWHAPRYTRRVPSVPKTKIVAAFGKRTAQASSATEVIGPDATLEFAVETAVATRRAEPKPGHRREITAGAFLALFAAVIAVGVYWQARQPAPAPVASGSLRIESDPAGAEVRLNGAVKGTTPLSVTMPVGDYQLAVQHGVNIKQLPVAISNGAVTVHHITWTDASPAALAADTGSLSVVTDTSGGQVIVDGEDRGPAPLTVRNLSTGQHRVVVRAGGSTYSRTVQIEAGSTASLVIGGGGGVTPGWISITSPVAVQVFEGRRLIGTSEMDRIMLSGGEHELELAADALGFRAIRRVRVSAGQTAVVAVEVPRAPLSINAVPWAEVFIDGSRVGETPLGNLQQTLGQHDIVFRHPQLGERRMTATVTLKDINRVTMDMRQR